MERQSRTWLCSVVFLDIVGYTQKAVTRQIGMKQRLQVIVDEAVAEVPKNERIIVDTGDGAALCFLGDPEEALFAALNLRERLVGEAGSDRESFAVRIGINLGPVKVVKSLSGHQNPLGDGINNAQRVMSFAEPNQILVSRSFYDVIACLSQEYAQLFHFLGMRKDKHVKEHAVYEVKIPEQAGVPVTVEIVSERIEKDKERQQAADNLIVLAWDPSVLKAAEQDLAEYIGPLAKVLVKRTAKQVSGTQALYEALASMIPDQRERARFMTHVPVAASAAGGQARQTTPPAGSAAPKGSWDPEVLKGLEQKLALYVGPLSRVLVKRAAQNTSDPMELCRLLAREIPNAEEQHAFLSAVQTGFPAGKT
jgi:class 3 adenylate cyclase